MNDLTLFKFHDSIEVRVLTSPDGDPLFVASDVALALGYRDAHNMVRMLDEDEVKGYSEVSTPGGPQMMTTVNESGLYYCIFRSEREEAKAFRKWVTNEVLPSIRKQGYYVVPTLKDLKDEIVGLRRDLSWQNPDLKKLLGRGSYLNGSSDTIRGLNGFGKDAAKSLRVLDHIVDRLRAGKPVDELVMRNALDPIRTLVMMVSR